jgi:hypothetical protein
MIPDHPLLLQGGPAFGFQTQQPLEWLFVAGALAVFAAVLLAMARASRLRSDGSIRSRILSLGDGIQRVTGMPAWSGAARAITAWALGVGFLGFVWDVAWHADLGRDRELFTVPHTLILMSLTAIGVAGAVSILYATLQRADVRWRIGRLRLPIGATVLIGLSAAAIVAFPLDDWWHSVYGIDVTMWSPTHLLMIGSASLAPLALAILAWESPGADNRRRRFQETVICGAMLVGLSTFQLEFDMGIPQWQALYHPVLIAAAAGFALVASRMLLGRWGALRAVLAFLVIRGVIALAVGPGLGHTVPHFPLYIVEALCVELAFVVTGSAAARALLAGVLIGTVGLATEWGWMHVWGAQPWQPEMLPQLWVATLIAVTAAFAATAFAGALLLSRTGHRLRLPGITALAAVVATAGLLLIPAPREASSAVATITTHPTGDAQTVTARDGQRVTVRTYTVRVQLSPADAAQGADWFRVAAWEGGSILNVPLQQVDRGVYVATRPVPVGGDWKSMVYLGKGSVLAAAPISFPPEPDQGLPWITVQPQRIAPLAAAQVLLMREAHGGGSAMASIAYAFFAIAVVTWLLAIGLGARWIRPTNRGTATPGPVRLPARSAAVAQR